MPSAFKINHKYALRMLAPVVQTDVAKRLRGQAIAASGKSAPMMLAYNEAYALDSVPSS